MQDLNGQKLKEVGVTLCLGAVGGAIAYFAGFPAPFLTGAAIIVTFACLLGLELSIPMLLRNACFISIGLSMGSGVTPDVINTIGLWPFAFAILIISLLGTFFTCRWLLIRFWQFDSRSASLAASPGHLSFILGLSSQNNVDIPTISIVQSIRVMVLTVMVPFAVQFLGLTENIVPLVRPRMEWVDLIWLAPLAALVGWGLSKLKFPAAYLLGGMLVSTAIHAGGVISGQIPTWLATIAFTIMGSLIGTRFSSISWRQLKAAAGAGIAAVSVALGFAVLAGSIASWSLGLPLAQLLIAYSPGGLEAMAAMAVIMHVDTTFVAAQHIFRLFFLTFLAPAVMAWEDRSERE